MGIELFAQKASPASSIVFDLWANKAQKYFWASISLVTYHHPVYNGGTEFSHCSRPHNSSTLLHPCSKPWDYTASQHSASNALEEKKRLATSSYTFKAWISQKRKQWVRNGKRKVYFCFRVTELGSTLLHDILKYFRCYRGSLFTTAVADLSQQEILLTYNSSKGGLHIQRAVVLDCPWRSSFPAFICLSLFHDIPSKMSLFYCL